MSLHMRWPKFWSFNFSISPSNEYSGCFPLGLTGLISLQSLGRLSNTTVQKHQFFRIQPSLWSSSEHLYVTIGKTIALTIKTFVDKVMSLLFIMLSRFVIAFLPRSKHLSILWLQSPPAVILEPKKIKVYHYFPIYLP